MKIECREDRARGWVRREFARRSRKSWPKKSARVPTDITEDIIRDVALPMGYVDIKVCAVNETWSGLKLVRRLANR